MIITGTMTTDGAGAESGDDETVETGSIENRQFTLSKAQIGGDTK